MRVDGTVVNDAQERYWNEGGGLRWASAYERIDSLFAPITAALLERAAPVAGESVLDIGCGSGATSLAFADRVGPDGRVVGVDISKPLLAVAADRARDRRPANVEFVHADAATHRFARPFDRAVSRFGVMFFADPVAAFANVRAALAPGGRLTFTCWRNLAENEWFGAPIEAAKPLVAPQPAPNPDDPGPLAFAKPDRVRGILAGAGFSGIHIEPRDVELRFGVRAAAVDFTLQIGPVSRLLDASQATAEQRAAVARAIDDAFARRESNDGVIFTAGLWMVRARA